MNGRAPKEAGAARDAYCTSAEQDSFRQCAGRQSGRYRRRTENGVPTWCKRRALRPRPPKSPRSRPRARAERMFASASRAGSEVSRRVREAIGRCFVPLPPGDFASSRPEGKIAREAGTDVVVSQRTARRCPSALRCDPQLHRKPKTTSVTRPMTPTTLAFLHQATWGPVFFAGAASLAETTPSAAEGSSANRQGPSSPERDLQPLSPLGAGPTWGDLQVQPRGAIVSVGVPCRPARTPG